MRKIIDSLKKNGVFAGQFFGDRDSWNKKYTRRVFLTKNEALSILKDMRVIEFQEVEKDGKTADGSKRHWHIFHFIAVK